MLENKKYLDKVIGSLVRGTKIDYEDKKIYFPFFHFSLPFSYFLSPSNFFITSSSYFVDYCINTFGLTDDEIDYVWNQYTSIILNKIKNVQ